MSSSSLSLLDSYSQRKDLPLLRLFNPQRLKKEGIYVALEGINGVGKSTAINNVANALRGLNYQVTTTLEPGGTSLGKRLRSILLEERDSNFPEQISPIAEMLLFAADRAQSVTQVVNPALIRGEIVLSDRSLLSAIAFQGTGRGLDETLIFEINARAVSGIIPDHIFVFDLPPDEAERRLQLRYANYPQNKSKDVMEKENSTFHQAVRDSFLRIAKSEPKWCTVISALLSPEEITEQVLKHCLSLLNQQGKNC
jgi:dTMP kinase